MSESKLTARIDSERCYVNLRGDEADAAFRQAAEQALGEALPTAANTISSAGHDAYWLGPDEWLIVSDETPADLMARLDAALAGQHAAVNDVSGGNVGFRVSGAAARELFAKGCTLDFHPRVFTVGRCAQSGLAKAPVLFGLLDDAPTFDVIVRRSFADYLERWLRHAGSDLGIEFV